MSIAEIRTDLLRRIDSGVLSSMPTPDLFEAELRCEVGDTLVKPTVMQLMAFHRALGDVAVKSDELKSRVVALQDVIRKVLNTTKYGLTSMAAHDTFSAAVRYDLARWPFAVG